MSRWWRVSVGAATHIAFAAVLAIPLSGEETAPGSPGEGKVRLAPAVGHTVAVLSVAFSPDGRAALTGSRDSTAKLWDVATGAVLWTLIGHDGWVQSAAFSPDGRSVLTGSWDGTAKLWDVASAAQLHTFSAQVVAAAFSPDGDFVLTGNADGTATLWDVASGAVLRTLHRHGAGVISVTFSPDGHSVLTGSYDGTAKLWDVASGVVLQTFTGHGNLVESVAFSPDGRSVLTGSRDKTARLWDVASGAQLRTFTGGARAVAFSPGGHSVLTGGEDGTAKLWDVASGVVLQTFTGHGNLVESVAFSPDGRSVLTGSQDSTAKLWDVASGAELRTFTSLSTWVTSVALSPDGHSVLTGSLDHTAKLWDVASGAQVWTFAGHSDPVASVTFSPDGRLVLTGSSDHTAKLWNVENGVELRTFTGHAGEVTSVAFSSDGHSVLTGSSDHTAKLWHVESGAELRTFVGHSDLVRSVTFSPDGRSVLTGSWDETAKLWDVESGAVLRTFTGHDEMVESVAFSPDGRSVLTGSWDETARLWDVASGAQLQTFAGHSDPVASVTFSPDGHSVIAGSYGRTAKLWDVTSGAELRTFTGHGEAVMSVAFSPDGRSVLTGSWDHTAKVWDAATGRELVTLISFTDGTWAVVDSKGRFDTNNLEEVRNLHWIAEDDPFSPLPVEIFMRDYYEPRLLPRVLAGEELPAIRDLSELNRVQPKVSIVSIDPRSDDPTQVSVTVAVASQRRDFDRPIGPVTIESGVQDVHLFRDGQLVGLEVGEVALDPEGRGRLQFDDVRLPLRPDQKEVEISAYAFNVDRVKSATDRETYPLPAGLSSRKGVAYVVSLGVNEYEHSSWDLDFAVNDAKAVQREIPVRLRVLGNYAEVVTVPLYSDDEQRLATKPVFRAVLDLLAGRDVSASVREQIPNAERIAPARPEDLVLLSFSGHGVAGEWGVFYLLLSDIGDNEALNEDLLERAVSSDELSDWLLDVDAGDMAFIIDACHSASSVEAEGFKPGPMGSRGLGQLAYNKGMLILAASQADDVALEHAALQQGLLSYALVQEGLAARRANFKPTDESIVLSEWLAYGVERVPSLWTDLSRGRVAGVTAVKGLDLELLAEARQNVGQRPSLFDFRRRQRHVVLWKADPSGDPAE